MGECGIPAPGRATNFSPDEIIIYGIQLTGEKGVIGVAVKSGGSGYGEGTTKIVFSGGGTNVKEAAAKPVISGGIITEIVMLKPGSGYNSVPTVTAVDTPTTGGTGADLVAVLGEIATINMEEGLWDIAIKGVYRGKVQGDDEKYLNIVAAYGYAYEGHCYRFDRPRLLGFTAKEIKAPIGCGFDPPPPPPSTTTSSSIDWYKAWRIRANKRIIELVTSVGRAEELILEANLPGRRAPNTYSGNMQMAHRGGRITDPRAGY